MQFHSTAVPAPAPALFAPCALCQNPTPIRDLDDRHGWCLPCRVEDYEQHHGSLRGSTDFAEEGSDDGEN